MSEVPLKSSPVKTYSYGRQTIENDDIEAVLSALQSDWLTQGPKVTQFENDLCEKFGAAGAAAVSNGTAGLHLIGLGLGWKAGDLVLTTANTFLASANCARYCGADVDFVDIDPVTYNISVSLLEKKIVELKAKGRKVTAVVAVDFAGRACDWPKLAQLAQKFEFDLVDDACHAMGAKVQGTELCSAKYAKAINLSFHPVKTITTGEGGAILSNDLKFLNRVKTFRTHGMTKDPLVLTQNEGSWYYEMHDLGFNFRMTDLQAALGSSQLKKLPRFNQRRKEIAQYYNTYLNQDFFESPQVTKAEEHVYHLYAALIKNENLVANKTKFFDALKTEGLNLQVHYYPVPLQPYYRKLYGFKESDFPNALAFYKRELSLPIYPALEDSDLKIIVKILNDTAAKISKGQSL